jgi:Fe-S oxidoreductase
VPGLELSEMADSRENSLWCGGGGGRIWMETPREDRLSELRVRQALAAGAEVLATSCPYCITNFTDSSLGLDEGDVLEIKDVTEIILAAL